MKNMKRHLEKLRKLNKRHYHHLIHKIHKKHGISKKTLFYIKEYGPHTNVPRTIIKESLKILFLASVLSSFGGLAIENAKLSILSITPILIMLPLLNGMIGNYGTVISAHISTLLHEGKVDERHWLNRKIARLAAQIMVVALITSIAGALGAMIIAGFSHNGIIIAHKVFLIAITDVLIMVSLLFLVSILAGFHYYKKNEDPNNFLIPITTAIADFGNMLILAAMVILFF